MFDHSEIMSRIMMRANETVKKSQELIAFLHVLRAHIEKTYAMLCSPDGSAPLHSAEERMASKRIRELNDVAEQIIRAAESALCFSLSISIIDRPVLPVIR